MALRFDDYVLDLKNFSLSHQGEDVAVEPQVFDLLVYLIEHRDRFVGRDELMDNVWEGRTVSDSTVSSCVKAARKALGDDAEKQHYIATASRRGYRFVGEISDVEIAAEQPTAPPADNPFRSKAPKETDKTSLAILPFHCRSKNDEDFWLSEVLGEDLSIMLAQVPGFWVISHSTMQHYRDEKVDVRELGKELGTQYLVEGTLMNMAGKYRISIQLVETATNQLLWAERQEFPVSDLENVENEMVAHIVASIEPAINRAELTQLGERRKANLSAWQLYRRSHALLAQQGWSEATFEESANILRDVIKMDGDMAIAHAYLSLVLSLGEALGLISGSEVHDEVKQAAETALRLDSQDSNVLGFVGCALVDVGADERGTGLLRKAIELNPSNAQALAALGASLLKAGNIDGLEFLRDGTRISPRDHRLAAWGALLSRGLLVCGKLGESLEIARDACNYDDKVYMPRILLSIAYWYNGDIEGAKAAIEDAKRIRPHLSVDDFMRFASPEEIEGMMEAKLLPA